MDQGRVTHLECEEGENDEAEMKEQTMVKIRHNDPFELRLKAISQDQCKFYNVSNKLTKRRESELTLDYQGFWR